MSYIIAVQPPVIQNPLTEEDPVRFTTGSTLEEAMAAGAPTVVRPATIEAVEYDGGKHLELDVFQKHIGGYIECAYRLPLDERRTIDFWGDEEALLKKLTPTMVRPTDGWVLRGPLVVCLGTAAGESYPLPDRYFNDVWGTFSVLGFLDKRRLPSD